VTVASDGSHPVNNPVSDPSNGDDRILASWQTNAVPWAAAVRERQIPSRRLVTDRAIVEAVLEGKPASVLDIGCGEGWLARALAAEGIAVTGVDAIAELIEQAHQASLGRQRVDFRTLSYEDIAAGRLTLTADAVVCNFALLGEASVEGLFAALRSLLAPQGHVLVQTLHPLIACGDGAYEDGWREGSWAGFPADFRDPAPWYFRTLESWTRLFSRHGLQLLELREPLHPQTQQPASVIFIARAAT
jgi:2-polyprenyl-3-methyl-5-hydroxy-6-metoxy-1,4-benzoquinol methylase